MTMRNVGAACVLAVLSALFGGACAADVDESVDRVSQDLRLADAAIEAEDETSMEVMDEDQDVEPSQTLNASAPPACVAACRRIYRICTLHASHIFAARYCTPRYHQCLRRCYPV